MPLIRSSDGHPLYVRVVGQGPTCLLVHGFASDSRSFLPFLGPLTRRYRFVLPDLRGFGRSAGVPLGSDDPLSVYGRDLAAVMTQLDLGRPALGGISMGAFSCLAHFRDHGSARARGYLHIDQGLAVHNDDIDGHGLLGPEQPGFFARIAALLADIAPYAHSPFERVPRRLRAALFEVFGQFVGAAFGSPRLGALAERVAGQELVGRRMLDVRHYPTLLTIMRAYVERRYDLRPAFASLALAPHVLIGGASRMYPAAGQERTVRALRPDARVTVLPGVGHVVPIEAPRAFGRALGQFLDEAYA
jgi:non-heme chloroperoxidase